MINLLIKSKMAAKKQGFLRFCVELSLHIYTVIQSPTINFALV